MNPTPQDDLDKQIDDLIIDRYNAINALPMQDEIREKYLKLPKQLGFKKQLKALIHSSNRRARQKGRIDELNYWFKLIEKNSDEAPIEVSLVKAIKVRLERLATLNQKDQE